MTKGHVHHQRLDAVGKGHPVWPLRSHKCNLNIQILKKGASRKHL